tara:strand:+ start:370 stop:702 length:333 start_codon:yes stop_codon:yes gene_type:complete
MKIIGDNNKGLFSDKKYKKNNIIHKLTGSVYDKPSRTTIEIGTNAHIDDEYGIYMNHSFSPNCIIKEGCIVALCDIDENNELTFNYNENETLMACPFIDKLTRVCVAGKE